MFKLHRIVWALMAVVLAARWGAGQAATQSVPTGLVDPIATVALDPNGNFKYLSLTSGGALIDGNGVGQTASGPFGFVAPVAPVAIDPNGNWQFLHVDVNGNLMTLVGINSGGSTTGGGTGAGIVAFTGGTLTSPLYLSGNPTTALQAATKAYVDSQISSVGLSSNPTFQNVAASALTLSGNVAAATGTISGLLNVGSITVANVTLTNTLSGVTGSFSGAMTVGGLGTFNTLAATSISVPSVVYAGSGAFVFGGNPQSSDLTSSTFTYPVAYWGPGQIFTTMDTSKNLRHIGDALTINGGSMPISAPCIGSNSSGQPISGTCTGGGGGGSFPTGTGLAVVTGGSAWGTTLTPPTSGTFVGLTDTQTITNKSIAFSEITGVTFPSSGIMVGTTDTQTLTNKSIAFGEITGQTFPTSGVIAGLTDTQTFTNKSIAATEINSGVLAMARMPTLATDQYIGTTSGTAPTGLSLPNCNTNFALTYTTGGAGFGCLSISPYNTFTAALAEEFMGGQQSLTGNIGSLGWSTSALGGTAATFTQNSAVQHPGIEVITTAATSGTGSEMYLSANGTINAGTTGAGNSTMTWIVEFSTVSSGAYRIGLMNTFNSTVVPTSGLYFRFDISKSDTNLKVCSDNASTETCYALGTSGAIAANTWYTLNMVQTTPGFYTMSVAGGTIGNSVPFCPTGCTTNLTVPTTNLAPAVAVSATTSTAVALSVDYMQFVQSITR